MSRGRWRHWRDFTPAQQKEFVAIFNEFLERTYIAKLICSSKRKKLFAKNITYTGETIDGQYALVESKIALKEEEIPLSYKLINKGGKWVVYDLTLEGWALSPITARSSMSCWQTAPMRS